jgi:hypothetical protein
MYVYMLKQLLNGSKALSISGNTFSYASVKGSAACEPRFGAYEFLMVVEANQLR